MEFCRHENFRNSKTLRLLAEFPSTVLDYLETYRLYKQGYEEGKRNRFEVPGRKPSHGINIP
jgi:hypothetical protein